MNSSNQSVVKVDIVYENLLTMTSVFNYYGVAVHFAYLLLILACDGFRKRPLVFVNHAVVVSTIYPCAILVFQYVNPATYLAQKQLELVNGLCSFFEYVWPVAVYMRMFSILLIAVHRYIATFKPDLFRRINRSNLLIGLMILGSWVLAIVLNVIDKYAFSTTYSITFCLDGFSPVWLNSLLYATYFVTLSMFVPGTAIVVIYVLINRKLKTLTKNLTGSQKFQLDSEREKRFANQFVLMCLSVVLNICGLSIFSVRTLVPDYFAVFYYVRPCVRSFVLVMTSLVPILSFAFNPYVKHLLKRSANRFASRVVFTTTSNQNENSAVTVK